MLRRFFKRLDGGGEVSLSGLRLGLFAQLPGGVERSLNILKLGGEERLLLNQQLDQ
jgi:hypothetical protein